jgi:hypothetical protein
MRVVGPACFNRRVPAVALWSSSNPAPPFFLGAAACHGGVGGAIGPIASKEGRFYNRPGVVTQKAERASPTKQ